MYKYKCSIQNVVYSRIPSLPYVSSLTVFTGTDKYCFVVRVSSLTPYKENGGISSELH